MPEAPKDIDLYQERFFTKLQQSLANIEIIAHDGKSSINAALKAIEDLKPFSEHVNQAHHEALCLAALKWLKVNYEGLEWTWQPTNTGSKNEADVEGRDKERNLIVVAECSASIEAKGTLRERMNSTLKKLNALSAKHKYYLVATESMALSAENSVKKLGYKIIVNKLSIK